MFFNYFLNFERRVSFRSAFLFLAFFFWKMHDDGDDFTHKTKLFLSPPFIETRIAYKYLHRLFARFIPVKGARIINIIWMIHQISAHTTNKKTSAIICTLSLLTLVGIGFCRICAVSSVLCLADCSVQNTISTRSPHTKHHTTAADTRRLFLRSTLTRLHFSCLLCGVRLLRCVVIGFAAHHKKAATSVVVTSPSNLRCALSAGELCVGVLVAAAAGAKCFLWTH